MDVLVGDTVSQVLLSEAVSVVSVELVLEMDIVWFGGLVAPSTA
jgi:hypothetical protein